MEKKELVPASLSSLAPSERKSLFSQVVTRADRVAGCHAITQLTSEPLDGFFPAVIALMEEKMVPAGEQAAAEAVELACQLMRCRRPEGEVLAGYVAILKDMPRDLLMPSIREAIAKETHHVLPTVGALLHGARNRFLERSETLIKTRLAFRRLKIAADWRQRGVCR